MSCPARTMSCRVHVVPVQLPCRPRAWLNRVVSCYARPTSVPRSCRARPLPCPVPVRVPTKTVLCRAVPCLAKTVPAPVHVLIKIMSFRAVPRHDRARTCVVPYLTVSCRVGTTCLTPLLTCCHSSAGKK
ncbi:hypothetical protein RHMOL_Rhmol12G0125000 [Rhododendron molle]|uniref:Uncharacterized protein n=1 Tax=Rhododendron molle TaxID=49168 RepID=A0ACC0LIX2_RHOML|nr:hypothetical protein RHMOL_Rhmol12G0125000 [Rhododendron molle]